MAKLRLNKILAQAGLTSRRGGDRLIVDGHVAVNGVVTRSPATLADPELDAIMVGGRPLPPRPVARDRRRPAPRAGPAPHRAPGPRPARRAPGGRPRAPRRARAAPRAPARARRAAR